MEKYINNKAVVKDDIYNLFKDSITCPLCKNILIEPLMCVKCQNSFCKTCIDNYMKKNQSCPNKCDEPDFQKCLTKNDILSKLKFKCKKCENDIYYDEVIKHQETCTSEKNSTNNNNNNNNIITERKKIEKVTSEEVDIYKKSGNELTYMTGKKANFI